MRDYDPEVGSYLEQDPMGILAGPNRYGYALGDPVQFIDPRGEHPLLIVAGVAIWFGIEAYSGFPTFVCLNAILEFECLNPDEFEACESVAIDAALGFGAGKVIGFAARMGAPIIRPVIRKFGPMILSGLERRLGRALGRISHLESELRLSQEFGLFQAITATGAVSF